LRDAASFWEQAGDAILAEAIPALWADIWGGIICTNEQCRNKKSCSNKPSYVGVDTYEGTLTLDSGEKRTVFVNVVTIYREIQCVSTTQGDDVPVIPDVGKKPKIYYSVI